jgi:hypothetical protein
MGTYHTEQERMLDEIRNRTVDAVRPRAAILIDDTSTHAGPFFAISALEDAAFDVGTGADEGDMSFIEDVADFTLPKGMTIYGTFQSIGLDSGKVIAYRI